MWKAIKRGMIPLLMVGIFSMGIIVGVVLGSNNAADAVPDTVGWLYHPQGVPTIFLWWDAATQGRGDAHWYIVITTPSGRQVQDKIVTVSLGADGAVTISAQSAGKTSLAQATIRSTTMTVVLSPNSPLWPLESLGFRTLTFVTADLSVYNQAVGGDIYGKP